MTTEIEGLVANASGDATQDDFVVPGESGETTVVVFTLGACEAGYYNTLYVRDRQTDQEFELFTNHTDEVDAVIALPFEAGHHLTFRLAQNAADPAVAQRGSRSFFADPAQNEGGRDQLRAWLDTDPSGGTSHALYAFEDLAPGSIANPRGLHDDADYDDMVFCVRPISIDLDVDSNNDGWIDPENGGSGTDDPIEAEYPGHCLTVYAGASTDLAEAAIRPLGMTPDQGGNWTGTLAFTGNITVWADVGRTTEITSGTSWDLYYVNQAPTTVYVECASPGTASMTWTVFAGGNAVGADTVALSLLETTMTVTNMAPETILPSGLLGDPYVIVSMDGAGNVRGGSVDVVNGNWVYSPHGTTFGTAAPWDPDHPYGGAPGDGPSGGASFLATLVDENGKNVKVNVKFEAAHSGYTLVHRGEWIESNPQGGAGGLMLSGSGYSPDPAFEWFMKQSGGSQDATSAGNIVVIGNKPSWQDDIDRAEFFYNLLGPATAHSVDLFDFQVNLTTDDLSGDAQAVVNDITKANLGQSGKELGHELIDKLQGAEAVYFLGGDQWPYVQLLKPGNGTNLAAKIISDRNNAGAVTVGGNSAGLAILGDYVFTAQSLAAGGDLTSQEALANPYTQHLVVPGTTTPAISNDVLGLRFMDEVIIDTHFAERDRMGRLVTFLAHMSVGFGLNHNAKGIGVDEDTAVCIDHGETAQVYGNGSAYFVKPKDQLDLPAVTNGAIAAPLAFPHLLVNRFDSDSGQFTFTNGWNLQNSSYYISVSLVDPKGDTWPQNHVWRDDQFFVTKDAYDKPYES